jgi:hypothetical protein
MIAGLLHTENVIIFTYLHLCAVQLEWLLMA